ncbi:MAG TPA: response regulator transcription factor [Phycisphaerae bacterium]|nr:response regulator transcription factor [Phycisphaerae bacterium]
MRVLVVEDYAPLRKAVAQGLKEAGYAVDAAVDGEEGLWYAESGTYDVIVLDLMLPGLDGLSLLKRLRKAGSATHVLILTAKDTLDDRVRGLDLGADDYLVKPFAFEELLARVRALIRRKYEAKDPVIRVADLEIDTGRRTVRRAGEPIPLTAHEYALLEFLAMRAGRIVTRTDIWEHVYAFHSSPESNVVDVYIGYLRRKIERAGLPRLIHTRRGQGYILGESA